MPGLTGLRYESGNYPTMKLQTYVKVSSVGTLPLHVMG